MMKKAKVYINIFIKIIQLLRTENSGDNKTYLNIGLIDWIELCIQKTYN